jgi:succinate-acetate transporter protein
MASKLDKDTIWALYAGHLDRSTGEGPGRAARRAFLFATFLLLAIGVLASPPNATIIHIGGWLGLVTAFLAWYHSAAGVTSATLGRTLLPVFPWKK